MTIEDQLRELILDGTLAPDSKINISKLKTTYAMSLAPLREALARLATSGLLIREPNKGFSVPPVSKKELIELYQASAHLESLALEQSIQQAGLDWEEEIVAALHHLKKVELSEKAPTYEAWTYANIRFHDALIAHCSPIIKELRSFLHLKMARYVRLAYGKAVPHLGAFYTEHENLAKTVLAKNSNLAKELMDKHIMNGRNLLIERMNDA